MSTYYSDDFKLQIVKLIESGKKQIDIAREFNVSAMAIRDWVKRYRTSGKFDRNAGLSADAKELKAIKKRVKQLELENEILKSAALILGRKSN